MGESKQIEIESHEYGSEEDDNDRYWDIHCSKCGNVTTWDPIYGDLCYRCIRADNE